MACPEKFKSTPADAYLYLPRLNAVEKLVPGILPDLEPV
jgi:hypothetical protein